MQGDDPARIDDLQLCWLTVYCFLVVLGWTIPFGRCCCVCVLFFLVSRVLYVGRRYLPHSYLYEYSRVQHSSSRSLVLCYRAGIYSILATSRAHTLDEQRCLNDRKKPSRRYAVSVGSGPVFIPAVSYVHAGSSICENIRMQQNIIIRRMSMAISTFSTRTWTAVRRPVYTTICVALLTTAAALPGTVYVVLLSIAVSIHNTVRCVIGVLSCYRRYLLFASWRW